MNVTTYAFTMVAAYVVGPGEYGAFVAALNFLIVLQVVALGLQATGARRIAADPGHVASVESGILRLSARISCGLGVLLLVLSPLVDRLLNLDNLVMAVVVALAAAPLTLAGGYAGILQGERRWAQLSLMYFMGGIPRLSIGVGLILLQPSATAALTGVAVGYLFPIAVGWWALRDRRAPAEQVVESGVRSMGAELVHNSQTLFAYFSLSSVDIIVARHVLDAHEAGLYAAGLIMAKAMMFLPQFVVLVAFPEMAQESNRHRALLRNLALILAVGIVATVVVALVPSLALVFVGGAEFSAIRTSLWAFAILGTVLSMLQLQVYAVLARQGWRSVVLVWLALGVLVVAGLTTSTVTGLATVVTAVDSVLMLGLLAASFLLRRGEVAAAADTQHGEAPPYT